MPAVGLVIVSVFFITLVLLVEVRLGEKTEGGSPAGAGVLATAADACVSFEMDDPDERKKNYAENPWYRNARVSMSHGKGDGSSAASHPHHHPFPHSWASPCVFCDEWRIV